MGLSDYIVLGVFVLIIGLIIWYVVREKKKGTVCIGCPDAATCQKGKSGCSGNCAGCSGSCSSCQTKN